MRALTSLLGDPAPCPISGVGPQRSWPHVSVLQRLISLAALALFLAAGIYGATLGFGTDRDSLRVIASAQSILSGGYLRSRSFGFPLHEAASALLFRLGGVLAVNLGTLAVTTAGILVARTLVPADRRGLLTCTLCTTPLLLANASSAIDFGWDFAAGMALCLVATRAFSAAGFFAAVLALLLLRPDNVLFAAAVTLALLMQPGAPRMRITAAAGLAGLAAASVYIGLNGTAMLAHGVTTTRPFGARVLRAGVFLSAALGPGGVVALISLARRLRAPARPLLARLVWLSWLLYLPRFAALPDQLDYLMLPALVTIVAAVSMLPARLAVIIAALVGAPSAITMSLLSRDEVTGAITIRPALQAGVLSQDWAARRFAARMAAPDMIALVQSRVELPPLHPDIFMPGYVSMAGDLIIGRRHLYRVLPVGHGPGALATVPRDRYRAVWTCDGALGPGIGWRGWEPPEPEPEPAFSCAPASPHTPGRS